MNVHDNIRVYRLASKMTQEELAKKVGVTKQTIQKYESGDIESVPSTRLLAICSALDVSPEILLEKSNYTAEDLSTIENGYRIKEILEKCSQLSNDNMDLLNIIVDGILCNQNRHQQ